MSKTANLATRLMASPIGRVVARPWLDHSILYLLKNWFFPLSRLWAAARAAEGDVDRFIQCVPLEEPNVSQRKLIARALREFETARLKAYSIEQLWRQYFFDEEEVAPERLPIIEEMRLDFRTAYNMTRNNFRPLRRLVKTSVATNPPTPEQAALRFGEQAELLQAQFVAPNVFPEIEVSRVISSKHGSDYWLRFPSPHPHMADQVYARVHEPLGVENPPTLIFGHGICVEFDHYHQLLDEVTQLTRLGIRVIRPEAPWHGRRVLPGHYGGEQLLSSIPVSMFDFVAAQHQEWATLINWCRSTQGGPVAIGGSSLGAQSAKTIAMSARHWPEHLQPDGLLIITHSQHITEAALDGALSDIWSLGDSMREAGWYQALERSWLQTIDPVQPCCVKGENIVTVCGSEDTVTPVQSALEQMDAWQVPEQNRFLYPRGHFTIPLGLLNDNAPLQRFSSIMKELT